jgi:hypothetical protein
MTALAERFGFAALKERIASLLKRDGGTAVPIRNWTSRWSGWWCSCSRSAW